MTTSLPATLSPVAMISHPAAAPDPEDSVADRNLGQLEAFEADAYV